MAEDKQYGRLDSFRVFAALLVVSIHTSPLSSLNPNADFLLTRALARLAVPFFMMTTGCFVLPQALFASPRSTRALWRFVKKTALLYGIATLIYLPVNLYADHFKQVGIFDVLRAVFFDGTFYHLWYLPAAIIGVLLVGLLSRWLRFRGILIVSSTLYLVGLLGDSYFGAASQVPVLLALYRAGFRIFSYTRNGLFFAPLFLCLGAWCGRDGSLPRRLAWPGFVLSLALMTAEALMLRHLGWPRHDSMYLLLPVCAFFLFALLVEKQAPANKRLRVLAAWVYLLHPLCIVFIRLMAKISDVFLPLQQNSMLYYLAVTLLAFLAALPIALLSLHRKRFCMSRAWIELDRAALRNNVLTLQSRLSSGCTLMAVVKANAYGHGATLMARELRLLGVSSFCVATALEGVELRKCGICGEILILGYTHPAQFVLLRRYRLTQTVIDAAYAALLNGYGKKISVQIALDTGMRRLGERCERIDSILHIFSCHNLVIKGVFSHLCADDADSPEARVYTRAQAETLETTIARLRQSGCAIKNIHLLASYGLLNYPTLEGSAVRVGIALYGMLGTRPDTNHCALPLQPVLSLKARVALVKDLFKGEAAGYGLTYVAEKDSKIAVLSIGYADGLPRALSCGVGKVLINGCAVPIIGRICMDQTMVDITGIPKVSSGDIAVLIGKSGDEEITACDLAEQTGTISNEILSRLGKRLERIVVP
ncbi:MAG: serine racemase VanT catalytic subunit [Eubacteriales bacterium]|nr:serine racemase VanT catalytic subunit [Eubacteriales bacterium]